MIYELLTKKNSKEFSMIKDNSHFSHEISNAVFWFINVLRKSAKKIVDLRFNIYLLNDD